MRRKESVGMRLSRGRRNPEASNEQNAKRTIPSVPAKQTTHAIFLHVQASAEATLVLQGRTTPHEKRAHTVAKPSGIACDRRIVPVLVVRVRGRMCVWEVLHGWVSQEVNVMGIMSRTNTNHRSHNVRGLLRLLVVLCAACGTQTVLGLQGG